MKRNNNLNITKEISESIGVKTNDKKFQDVYHKLPTIDRWYKSTE